MGKQQSTLEGMEIKKSKVTKAFWKNKKVLVTGHTGFKGSWLCILLIELGCEVIGYSLEPNTSPNLLLKPILKMVSFQL